MKIQAYTLGCFEGSVNFRTDTYRLFASELQISPYRRRKKLTARIFLRVSLQKRSDMEVRDMTRILLVEDDGMIVRTLKDFLYTEGFCVDSTDGQGEALKLLEEAEYDLALLDVSLRDGNGFSLCSAIKKNRQLPVIFLTASGDEFSVVTGLDLGADDYIAKPFRPRELVSRINSVLRRCGKSQKIFDIENIRVDLDKGVVYKNGQDLYLSALEYRLLLAFINSAGSLLTRSRLLEEIWDVAGDFVNDNTLTVYIKRLRDKIEDNPAEPRIIVTVRGMGYKLGKQGEKC